MGSKKYVNKIRLNIPIEFNIKLGANTRKRFKSTTKLRNLKGGLAYKYDNNIKTKLTNDNVMGFLSKKLNTHPLKKILLKNYKSNDNFTKRFNDTIFGFLIEQKPNTVGSKMVALFQNEMYKGGLGYNLSGLRWGIKTGQMVGSFQYHVSKKSNSDFKK